MNINYISLGSFCHPKIFLRKNNKEILKSLPFDFHSSPNTYSIYQILNKLAADKTYVHNFKEILFEHEHNDKSKKELAVSDEEGMFFLHFFDVNDKLNDNVEYPIPVTDNLNENKMNDIKYKFMKRYEKLYDILTTNNNNILIFLIIENYENKSWETDVANLAKSLSQFNHPNKFLIYAQNQINDNLDFINTTRINYEYGFPIIFYKCLFDEKITSNQESEKKFSNVLNDIEKIIDLCIIIEIHNIRYCFYYDKPNKKMFKLNNIHYILDIRTFNDKILEANWENNLLVFLKNKENVYQLIS